MINSSSRETAEERDWEAWVGLGLIMCVFPVSLWGLVPYKTTGFDCSWQLPTIQLKNVACWLFRACNA